MGQINFCNCTSPSDQNRLVDLQNSIRTQSQQTVELRQKLKEESKQYEADQNNLKNISSEKIEKLSLEKKQLFKSMLKEKKHVSKLEDEIQDYKKQLKEMKQKMNTLKRRKAEKERNGREDRIIIKEVEEDSSDSFDSDVELVHQETIVLDVDFDAKYEVAHIYGWMHGPDFDPKSKKCITHLKQRLATLLTSRSEGYKQNLIESYREQYGKGLVKEIKQFISKGNSLYIICGLLMTRAEYDAVLISQYVANWDIENVAGIICCRSLSQIKELHDAYKRKCMLDIKRQLQALAHKDKKKTLVKIIGRIFDLDRTEPEVDIKDINTDLSFILTTKQFKDANKERLVSIFTANSVDYVKVLNDQFKLKSKDSLTTFIDKKLGPKSTVGYFCKTRIKYALSPPDYFAKKILKLGAQFKKNQKKIADIFIQRMENDLDIIQRIWKVNKYADGKELKAWIMTKCHGKSGTFLSKMLDNCGRYAEFNALTTGNRNTLRGTTAAKFAKLMM